MQIKITGHHFTPARKAVIQKATSDKLMRTWKNRNPHVLLVRTFDGAAALGNSLAAPQRLNIDLPRDPATPTPKNITKINENMCAQKNFYVNIHHSIIDTI